MPATLTRAADAQPLRPVAVDGSVMAQAASIDTSIRVLIAEGKALVRAA